MTMTANFVHSPHSRSRHRNPKVASTSLSPLAQQPHHHRTSSQRLPRDAPPSSGGDNSNLHRRRAVAEMSIMNQNGFVFGGNYNDTSNGGGSGRTLTPKMLHATNSKSLRELLGHETSRDTTIAGTTTNGTNNVGNMFRSGATTYFTSGSGRILPTNTWEMYQAQQQQPHQRQRHANANTTSSSSSTVAALYHHPTSNGQPHYLKTPSRKQDNAVPSVVSPSHSPPPTIAVTSSAATVDLGYHDPNTASSSHRQRLTFPTTNGKAPDLPFCSTMQCENVVPAAGQYYYQGGHCQSSRRRHTISSSTNTSTVGKRQDVILTPRKKEEVMVVPPSPASTTTTKGKAPDPPPSPYPMHTPPMTSSFRRCVSMPTHTINNNNSTLKTTSSSSGNANSSTHHHQQLQLQLQLQLQQRRHHSLPIISEYEDNQSYCTWTNSPKKSNSRSSNRPIMPSLRRKDLNVQKSNPSSSSNEASVYHTSSSDEASVHHTLSLNEHTTCHQYQVGEPLRDQSHSIAFTSPDQAWILLSKLPVNSPLFVKRTSREWTYATLVSWVDEELPHDPHLYDDHDGGSLVASLHSTRNVKKVLKKDRWEKCLRLVNANMVDADGLITTTAANTTAAAKVVAASPNSVAAGNSSGEALYPSDTSSATMMNTGTPSSSNTSSSYRNLLSDLYSSANTVSSVVEDNGLAFDNPFVVRNQSATARSVDDSRLGDVVRNLFSEDSSNAASAIEKPSPNTVGQQSLTRSASLNSLHSKKVSWRLSHSLNDLANNEDDAISSKTDATPLRSGATAGSSNCSPSGCSLFDNHTRSSHASSESSPDTVNLHARHFVGSRRERMRPRGMNRSNDKPRRSRSSGSISLCDESDRAQRVWCDSTCAPESGSISDASGGSVWKTLVENKSRKEKGLPTLPYYFP